MLIINPSVFSLPLWFKITSSFILALAISLYAIPSIVTVSRIKNLFALPNGRTSHEGSIPNLGGVAIFAAFLMPTIFIAGRYFSLQLIYLFAGLVMVFFVGIKDDILILDPRKKMAAQIIATIIVSVPADIRITHFYGLLGITEVPYLVSVLVTVFVMVLIINGFNLIDGIDGLSSGTGFLATSIFGIWFWVCGNNAFSILSFAFAGALCGFFWYNNFSQKNKIFLGDTGSLIIGFIVAVLTVKFLQLNIFAEGPLNILSAPAFAVSVLIIPLFDTLRVFTLRISQGKSPFVADRQHIHHMFLRSGFSHLQATAILLIVNIAFVIVGYLLRKVGNLRLLLFSLSVAVLLVYFLNIYGQRRAKRISDNEFDRALRRYRMSQKHLAFHRNTRDYDLKNIRRIEEEITKIF